MTEFTTHLSLDFETRSEIDLTARGLDVYSAHASTEVLMLGWAVNDEEPQLWLPSEGPMPTRLRNHLESPKVQKRAWNSQFERIIFKRILKMDIPVSQWRCTMVNAFMLALPGSLDMCGKVMQVGSEYQKDAEGKALIRLFCMPQVPNKGASAKTVLDYERRFERRGDHLWATPRTHPEEWARFCFYCRRDVVSERRIGKLISKYPVPDWMWRLYRVDQDINDRGVPIDLVWVDKAIAIVARRRAELIDELKSSTRLKNPNSGAQLLPWLRERGYPFSSLKKDRVEKALDDFSASMTHECQVALTQRLTIAMASVKKLLAIKAMVGEGDRLRFQYQMAGAGRTNRFAGRGVQLQNFPRPAKTHEDFLTTIRDLVNENDYEGLRMFFGCPIAAISSCLRGAIAAPPGKTFVVSDLSSIETRVIAEASNCSGLKNVFAKGLDAYKDFATAVFGVAYADVEKWMRQLAKPAVLGCGFMLGGGGEHGEYPDTFKTGLLGYAASMKVKMTAEQAAEHVRAFRERYYEIPVLWAELDAAVIRCVQTKQPQKVGCFEYDIMNPFLRMKLPSGRYIYYLRPRIGKHTIKAPGRQPFTKIGLSYEGKDKAGKWTRLASHAGRATENGVQAIAFDTLAQDMLWADEDGFFIIGHSHDEQITEKDEFDDDHTLEALNGLMGRSMPWLPNMALAAEGHESPWYKK